MLAALLWGAGAGAAAFPQFIELADGDEPGSVPSFLMVCGDYLYFSADDGISGRELWALSPEGALRQVADIWPGPPSSAPRKPACTEGVLYFVGDYLAGPSSRVEVFAVASPDKGVRRFIHKHYRFEVLRHGLVGGVFYGVVDTEQGRGLWRIRYDTGEVEMLKRLGSAATGAAPPSEPIDFPVISDRFFLQTEFEGPEGAAVIFRIDGTSHAIERVAFQGSSGAPGNYYFFPGRDRDFAFSIQASEMVFWEIDRPTGDLVWLGATDDPPAYEVFEAMELGKKAIFAGYTKEHGRELWSAHFETGAFEMVRDIYPGPTSGGGHKLTPLGDGVHGVFVADDEDHGSELWVTDGTEAGTRLLVDMVPGPVRSDPYSLHPYGAGFFFSSNHNEYGEELWFMDDLSGAPRLVRDLMPGRAISEPYYLSTFNDRVYYCARSPERGIELWSSDATDEGTRIEAAIKPRLRMVFDDAPASLVVLNDHLYFTGVGPDGLWGLWKSDGTQKGCEPVALSPWVDDNAPHVWMERDGDRLRIRWRSVVGKEHDIHFEPESGVWTRNEARQPGTAKEAIPCLDEAAFREQFPGSGTYPPDGVMAGEVFVFRAYRPETGHELWGKRCEDEDARLLMDIVPGPGSSQPRYFTSFRHWALFQAYDVNHGAELWASDGTEAGTWRLFDGLPTPRSSLPHGFLIWRDHLLRSTRLLDDRWDLGLLQLDPVSLVWERHIPLMESAKDFQGAAMLNDELFFLAWRPHLGMALYGVSGLDYLPRLVYVLRPPAGYDPEDQTWWVGYRPGAAR